MLKLSSKAEVKAVVVRKQFSGGDDREKAVSLRLRFPAIALEAAREFVSQLSLFYGVETESQFPEIDELRVTRTLEDVLVVVNGVKLRGQVKRIKVYPRGGRTVEVDLMVHSKIDKGLDKLHDVLLETVPVDMHESPPTAVPDSGVPATG